MKKIIFTLTLLMGFFFSNANSNSFGPDSVCSVMIDTIQNGACFQAIPSGTAPFTYLWNDNSTNSTTCASPLFNMYCVTITDATGCVAVACTGNNAPSCDVWISMDSMTGSNVPQLFANSSGPGAYTYAWSTGEVSASIVPSASGTYCVTVTDANNCSDSDCVTVDLNSNPNCSVDVVPVFGSTCLQANPTGTAPFTYQWNDGTTDQTACVNNPAGDSLCVVVTDANGCVATACGVTGNGGGGNNCDVTIAFTGAGLSAIPSGDPNQSYTYMWSTGELTPTINPMASGTYCVTITTANGCTATDCATLTLANEVSGYLILDSLGMINNGVNTFLVYLIEHDTVAGTLTALDSIMVTSTPNNVGGYYSFSNVGDGSYLVKAAIQPGSDQYDNYLPTYHGDVLYWNEATTVFVPGNNDFTNITLIAGVNPGGPGFIGGLISEGANFTSGQVETRDEGDPIENVSVLLLTENDEPITHTVTDADGRFEFPNLAWGTYKIVVEVLGKEQGIHLVTINKENSNPTINFGVNEGNITNVEDILNGETLKVFPNPVTDNLNIQVEIRENVQLKVAVISLLGKTLLSENIQFQEGHQQMRINLQNLPRGIYFLNLSDGQSMISRKITKQ